MFDPRGGISLQRRICPICDHPIKYGHYCSFCKQWIRNPNYVNATYYLNERHPRQRRTVSITMRDLPCGKRVQGQAQMPSARLRTGRRYIPRCRKAAGAGRQASVRTQNQNSMSYQTTQRRSAVQQGKNQKKKGKMSLVLVILLILFALSGINYLYRMFMYFIWFL